MNDPRRARAKEVFAAALDAPVTRREALLREASGDDPDLLGEVRSLLAAHDRAGGFLVAVDPGFLSHALDASRNTGAASSNPDAVRSRIGQRIGAYRLVELIGTGGMSEVYRARRVDAEFDKEVAVKIVPGGFQTHFILRGLRAERQILADLDHPHIARLIDGGVTEDGAPYLIMDLVEGAPIDQYCDERGSSLEKRLKLFCDVCGAVSYAHQHLVVHRDLKPGNILVTHDGTVKLLDFGIAKLLDPSPTTDTAPTQTFSRALTPGYSSPEQILGRPITTASDVYSLGVVLYQLLTGRSPYRSALRSTQDAIREVCESEPPRPSDVGRQDGAARLPRDLDAITLRALRKEPERRYASVEQFSEDIRNYLGGRPVVARGDQLSYRAGKYLRRNRWQIAGVALIAMALLGGTVASLRQAHRAEAEQARAERHFKSVRQLANTFLFEMNDSIKDLPDSTDARRKLVTTGLRYLNALEKEASGNASLERELADAYIQVGDIQGKVYEVNIGEPRAALTSYSQAVGLYERLVGKSPTDEELRQKLAQAYNRRSLLRMTLGETRPAVEDLHRALSMLESRAAAHPTTGARLDLARAYGTSIQILQQADDPAQALANVSRAISILEKLAAQHPDDRDVELSLANAYNNKGIVLFPADLSSTSRDEAERLFLKSIAVYERLSAAAGGFNPRLLRGRMAAYTNLCDVSYWKGDLAEAVERCGKVQPILERLYSDKDNAQIHLDAAAFRWYYARALLASGDLAGAARRFRENVDTLAISLKTSDALDVQYWFAASQQGLGDIEMRLAALPTGSPAARVTHWRAAKQLFESAIPRLRSVHAKETMNAVDHLPLTNAIAGLATAEAALAR